VDLESIKSIWESWKEVQEKKALDPVGKADGDIDNDGDEDESDEYLANRRKKIGKEISKDNVKEEDDSEEDDSEEDSDDDEKKSKKPKKGVNPFAKKKDDEDDEDEDDEDDVKEAKEYSYTVVHAKKGKVVVKAPTSYDAAQKAAKQWKLKSTAGIDSYIMEDTDVKMPEWLQVIGEKLRAMEESDDPVADEKEAYKDDKKPNKGIKKDDEEESDNGEPTTEKMKGMRKEDFASEADWRVASMREALAVMEANKQTQGATKSEPYDDTASQGSKDFIKMHKKSNPDLEDLEDNKAVLPTGVKSQSPSRRGDNLDNGDGKKPKK